MTQYRQHEDLGIYVSRYLVRKMKAVELSRAELAARVGVSERTVQRWRNGDIQYLDTVCKIARGLRVSVAEVFSEWEDDPYAHSFDTERGCKKSPTRKRAMVVRRDAIALLRKLWKKLKFCMQKTSLCEKRRRRC